MHCISGAVEGWEREKIYRKVESGRTRSKALSPSQDAIFLLNEKKNLVFSNPHRNHVRAPLLLPLFLLPPPSPFTYFMLGSSGPPIPLRPPSPRPLGGNAGRSEVHLVRIAVLAEIDFAPRSVRIQIFPSYVPFGTGEFQCAHGRRLGGSEGATSKWRTPPDEGTVSSLAFCPPLRTMMEFETRMGRDGGYIRRCSGYSRDGLAFVVGRGGGSGRV